MTAATVFALPELLENIILNLPLRSILISKRVSKSFAATIDSSIWIRRALFLEPASTARASWNRLHDRDCSYDGRWRDQKQCDVAPILNPFLAVTDVVSFYSPKPWYHEQLNGLYLGQNEIFALGPAENEHRILHFESEYDDKSDLLDMLKVSKSSFKHMSIASPPIPRLTIDDNIVRTTTENGLQIEDLLDSVLALSGVDENENDFELEGFDDCRVLAKTVDEITGWEVLRVILLPEAQLDTEGLLLEV